MKDEDLPGLFFFSIYFTRWRISSRFLRELSVDHLDCSVCNKILLEIQFTSDAQLCPARFYFIIIIRRVHQSYFRFSYSLERSLLLRRSEGI